MEVVIEKMTWWRWSLRGGNILRSAAQPTFSVLDIRPVKLAPAAAHFDGLNNFEAHTDKEVVSVTYSSSSILASFVAFKVHVNFEKHAWHT